MRGKKVAVIRHENQKSSVIGCQLSPRLSGELLGVLCFSHPRLLEGFSDELVPLERLNGNVIMSQTMNQQSTVRLSI